ncbi:hypothetical protein TrLO_g675 [Triparma laevis f. longispina]|uniref:Uncharacterized protein n=1 Tax=Triparma laevis f. longispina TaxID=1714387 RepID=A0A9W7FSR6_9STRA|nr:hypothetical protein TrLO_g675 [Triparma laevis f. longispina]
MKSIEYYITLASVAVPILGLGYSTSFFCQPRKYSPKDLWKLRLHFTSFAYISETALGVQAFRVGDIKWVGLHFAAAVIFTVMFHCALKLRANVGRLPDEDLEAFLIDKLFKGGLRTLFSILFLLFRTTKCVFKKGDLTECSNTS